MTNAAKPLRTAKARLTELEKIVLPDQKQALEELKKMYSNLAFLYRVKTYLSAKYDDEVARSITD